MNARMNLLAGLALGGALLVGCEERPEASPDRTTPIIPDRTVTPTPSTPSTMDTDAATRALTLIQRCRDQISAAQFDAAEQTLDELEGLKSSLPAATQRQIEQLRSDFNQRRSAPPTTTTPPSPVPSTPDNP